MSSKKSIIGKIKEAVKKGSLNPVFTTKDVKNLVRENKITKPDGTIYAEASISSILSNSSVRNIGSSSTNSKMLGSRLINERTREYWFLNL
ncbi:hypothetical protein [Pseudoalteromonas distincta]|uniref:hypothetical protein n=1 Tax=Pseudoalteromonas distincta TaxID=77608 RepID=UPI00186A866F|nr:hypothetical protein [Pseudoalteromonas distincta]